MKNNINNWLKGSISAFAAVALFAACADDHFDVSAQGGSDQTLWQQIKADESLSQFADIMSRITFMKSENDRSATLKFSELLNQDQAYTVVAPVNGSLNYETWSSMIDEAVEKRKSDDQMTEREGRNLMYLLSNQFAANHIARFSYNLSQDQTVHLLNGKNVDSKANVFNGVEMTGETILGRNGMLYKLSGLNPFAYNLYDYLSADEDFNAINSYIKDPSIEKETFSESASIPGALNEDGNMVYIDSVIIRTNELLDRLGIRIQNEDSCYVALIPTNSAWEEAKAKVQSLYNYGKSYKYDWQGTDFKSELKMDDSNLSVEKTNEAIITNMFFQPYRMGLESKKDHAIIDYMMKADSLISSTGTIFYNEAAVKGERNEHLNPALENTTEVSVSNGYILKLNDYKFNPAYVWQKDLSFRPARSASHYTARTLNCDTPNGYPNYLAIDNRNEKILGDVEENAYQTYAVSNSEAQFEVDFKLFDVLSGDYTIQIVLVPTNINLNNFYDTEDAPFTENLCFYADIIDDAGKKSAAYPTVKYAYDIVDSRENNNKKDAIIIPQMDKVTTLTLFEKFHFDKCYKDVPCPQGNTFPRLRLTIPRGRKFADFNLAYAPLNIVKIICTPYRGGAEKVEE